MLIGFTSGKGAPGATLAVANIGVALAAAGQSVLAVDLDPIGGVLAAYLGGAPGRGLFPLAYTHTPPTTENLASQVQVLHGLPVIAGLSRALDVAGIDLVQVARLVAGLAEVVLVDAGRVPGLSAVVLGTCDRTAVVVEADPVGILAGEQAVDSLPVSVFHRSGVLVTGTTDRAELAEVAELLHIPVIGAIPWDAAEVRRARQRQAPLGGKAGKAYAAVAATIAPLSRAAAAQHAAAREVTSFGG